jgi:hypothetical protein
MMSVKTLQFNILGMLLVTIGLTGCTLNPMDLAVTDNAKYPVDNLVIEDAKISDFPGKWVMRAHREDLKIGDHRSRNYLVTEDGFEPITDINESFWKPIWSPSGKYVLTGPTETKELYIVEPHTKTIVRKINYEWERDSIINTYNWITDDKIVYLHGQYGGPLIPFQVIVHDLKTNQKEKIYELGRKEDTSDIFVSPDRKKIAIQVVSKLGLKTPFRIIVIDLETRAVKVLQGQAGLAGWYNDGKHLLVYSNIRPDQKSLFNKKSGIVRRLNILTQEFEVIFTPPYFLYEPRISDDNKYMYYALITNRGREFYVQPIDGNVAYRITYNAPLTLTKAMDDGTVKEIHDNTSDITADWHQE